ncbi:MAG: MFS transporter [Methanobacteriota archaeon]|nr:MAG: MFS transporter [Euryarchaeota archaeon]
MESTVPAAAGHLPEGRRFGFSEVPRKVRWIICVNAGGGIAFGYLMIFLTAYLPQIGIEAGTIGLLLGANGAATVLFAIPLGLYSDRRGRKRPLIAASAVLPVMILIFGLTTDLVWLLLASLVAGVAEGALLSTWNAIIADQTTPDQRGAAFALSFVLGNIFGGIGSALPIAFPAIEGATGWDSHTVHVLALVATDAVAALVPIALFVLLRDYREILRPPEARPKTTNWSRLLKFSGLNGLIGLGAGFFIPLLATWLLLKHGVPDTYSGPLLAVSNITIGLSAVGSAALARQVGPVRAIVTAQGLSTAFLLSLAFVGSPVLAAGLYMVRAGLMNMSAPIADSFLMGIVTPEQRGLASAVNSIIWRLPNSITTVIGGILMESGQLDLPIFLATIFYVLSISGFYTVFRRVTPTI